MSDPGPSEPALSGRSHPPSLRPARGVRRHVDRLSREREQHLRTPPLGGAATRSSTGQTPVMMPRERSIRELPFAHLRIHFEDFAAQLRSHRHQEHRKRMLAHRKRHLQKAVALSARLQRVGSWIHDGLVEISGHADTSGFIRVHQHMQDLVDLCISQWNHEIRAMDSPYGVEELPTPPGDGGAESFWSQLPPSSREDCIELIHTLRSKPLFLVERFKAMSPARISALSTFPRYQDLAESVLTSLSHNRGRSSQKKRIKAFSKGLEEYASSFERSNPLSFLLYNIYGPAKDVSAHESQLRLSTWSTICATLMMDADPAYQALIGQVLSGFATLYEWQMKDRFELFLMSILQRGAFLLDMVHNSSSHVESPLGSAVSPFDTEQARDFFDSAVGELFAILSSDGGFPVGALQLGCAIVGKVSSIEAQSQFRGQFFQWFLSNFLRITITFPEDEKMLLDFHISESARTNLLHQVWTRANARAWDVFTPMYHPFPSSVAGLTMGGRPLQEIDPHIRFCVEKMIAQLVPNDHCVDPYTLITPSNPPWPTPTKLEPPPAFVTLCAADIAHILEALSPQYIYTSSSWDFFLSSSLSAFHAQYSRASNKFDRLLRSILDVVEPGQSSKNIHPCQENWVTLVIEGGNPRDPTTGFEQRQPPRRGTDGWWWLLEPEELDPAQHAVVRLLTEQFSSDGPQQQSGFRTEAPGEEDVCVSVLFSEQIRMAQNKADNVAALYWHNALQFLRTNYPLTVLARDDTKVLEWMRDQLCTAQARCADDCSHLESQLVILEEWYGQARTQMSKLSGRLDKLRVKLWYSMDVTNSNAYEDARNISVALNNMALSALKRAESDKRESPGPSRPSTATSTSSLFDQPRVDTMSILKAAAEHGGPKKLSDPQIDMTKKWLERNQIDNFCKGEERIHRFCMEVRMATRKLVGETLAESPVLWSSELFAPEKTLFEIHATATLSAPASTRAPSVMSETPSSTLFPGGRPGFTGSRSSFHSLASGRFGRDASGSEWASSQGSPGRALTVTTTESLSSVWSPAASHSRSVTSASLQSRPGSTFDEFGLSRLGDMSPEKTSFLESLKQGLTCLLLSDLGCPVWSCGSETDAWMETVRQTPSIDKQLQHRAVTARLLAGRPLTGGTPTTSSSPARTVLRKRSQSASACLRSGEGPAREDDAASNTLEDMMIGAIDAGFSYPAALQDVLDRISQHVDPCLKLKAVHDFKTLSQAAAQAEAWDPSMEEGGLDPRSESTPNPRRQSLNPSHLSANMARHVRPSEGEKGRSMAVVAEADMIQYLRRLLFRLRPKTLFRDLQYIAAFVSSDVLNNSESGRAFLHVGLAALAWKDEVCRSMVDVADQIVTRDAIKRRASPARANEAHILRAAEYWMIAAREGNAIAQRELAILYLTHPDVPPIVSLPLSLSADIFKNEMMWEDGDGSRQNRQGLCLALHWMQLAAENGDEVARRKLTERSGSHSIR